MGMLDDNGPLSNMLINQALFNVPSTRPPGEVADDMGIAVAIAGGLAVLGGLCYGAWKGTEYLIDTAFPEPEPVVQALSQDHQSRFENYQQTPKSECIKEFRDLTVAHDLLKHFESLQQVGLDSVTESLLLEKLPEFKSALKSLESDSVRKNAEYSDVYLGYNVLKEIVDTSRIPPNAQLEVAQSSIKSILFSLAE